MIIACDIDGVLADVRDFYYLIPDWEEYYKHTLELPIIPEMIMLVDSLIVGKHSVVFITGRPQRTEQDTKLWLLKNIPNLSIVDIKMRQNGDPRQTVDIKLEMLKDLYTSLVIEDEPRAVAAMMANGYTVLQVHGYRHTVEDSVPY